MKERRKFIRIDEQTAVSYSVMPNYKSERKLTQDLSLGGIKFISDHFMPVGSILKIEIRLKHIPKVINAVVKLIWIKAIFNDEQYDVGVEFVHIDREDLEFMHDYLSRNPPP